jgi:6,7-dimethyl-8-ribityllumazine synthase
VTTRREHGRAGEGSLPVELPPGVGPHRGSLSGEGLHIGIVASRFNQDVTDLLLKGAIEALAEAGVADDRIVAVSVPGAFEIPGAAQALASRVDAVVCLGAVIRGETEHFTYVASAVQQGVVRVSLDTGVPVIFGVLTTDNVEQALDRAGGELGNKGAEAAMDAVEMANLYALLRNP